MSRVDRTELLRRTDLAGLLDRLAPPAERRHRGRWRCLHPDHEDRHPSVSMTVVDGIGRWRCWSCGRGGTAIDALIAAQGLTVAQAMERLAARAVPGPIRQEGSEHEPIPHHPSVESYVEACHRVLFTKTGRPILEWLADDRLLAVDVLRANRVGADPGPDLLPRRRGLPRSGVAVVLPAFDPTGTLTYVQARYLNPGSGRKYGNP
ncbi:MAG: CHC2 zinc finger domain-containing protein, partial [Acidimicrobiia bacterium]